MTTIKRILGWSIVVIMFFYSLYVTYMIVKESNPADLYSIETEDEFNKVLSPHLEIFYNNNKILLHIINVLCWLMLIKVFLLFIW